jgi:hypothetical protein
MRLMTAAALILVSATLLTHGQKTRYGQSLPKVQSGVVYPMTVHVYATHYRPLCSNGGYCNDAVSVDAMVKGKKVELEGDIVVNHHLHQTLALGDYPARILPKAHDSDPISIGQKYELEIPDKYRWMFVVSEVAE